MIPKSKFWTEQTAFNMCTLQEFENHAAQLHGAKVELKVDIITKAEEHAEALNRAAAEVQQ